MSFPRLFLLPALLLLGAPFARANPFRSDDVVSFVGGEDMVAAAEAGFVEYLEAESHDQNVKFRSLAKEGDTVFEQHRDLNYPPLEDQLQSYGTTVIVAEFGLMEALENPADPHAFITAYGALLTRLSPKASRRLILIAPPAFEKQIAQLAERRHATLVKLPHEASQLRDGIHLNTLGQLELARRIIAAMGDTPAPEIGLADLEGNQLLQTIRAKNRLWFEYYRPQNWAFLAGDRTSQPSSRDYKDPSIRWFPKEMEEFLPLIAIKESDIEHLAAAKFHLK